MNLSRSAVAHLVDIGRIESAAFSVSLLIEIEAADEDASERAWRTFHFHAEGSLTHWRLARPFHRYVVEVDAGGIVTGIAYDSRA